VSRFGDWLFSSRLRSRRVRRPAPCRPPASRDARSMGSSVTPRPPSDSAESQAAGAYCFEERSMLSSGSSRGDRCCQGRSPCSTPQKRLSRRQSPCLCLPGRGKELPAVVQVALFWQGHRWRTADPIGHGRTRSSQVQLRCCVSWIWSGRLRSVPTACSLGPASIRPADSRRPRTNQP